MINRRKFLHLTGTGAAGILTSGLASIISAPDVGAATGENNKFNPDLDIDLIARESEIPIFPGKPTYAWTYRGNLIKGDHTSLIENRSSYLGPTLQVKKGQKVRIRFTNDIPEETIVHWHGLHVPAVMDGHPSYVIPRGETYTYEFEVKNRAGTYWYHPHPHGRTGPQVYGGMAGLFLVSDEADEAAGLPAGQYDIPLVIQDRSFDTDNQLMYLSGHMMEQMVGFLGDRILVNGKPDYILPVATRPYRLRLLNGSNSRIYKLAWKDGRPLTVIGTDGGLLEKPVQKRYVMLAPAERLEIWADFSTYPVDSQTALVSLPFDTNMAGGGRMRQRGMMGRRGSGMLGRENDPSNGDPFTIFKVHVKTKETERYPLPDRLVRIPRYRPEAAVNFKQPRTFRLAMQHMSGVINGRTFKMNEVADDEVVRMGTLEQWGFVNDARGMGMMGMMNQPHPMHLHGKQFQVLERQGVAHDGYIDEGWKDTVLVMPGERVRILVRFDDYPGLFLYHCHNLEHEDMGMMRNYYVRQ